MKIAIVVHQFPSMSQTFVLSQITSLMDAGHDVDIYANTAGREEYAHPDVERYGLLRRTFYWRWPAKGRAKVLWLLGTGVLRFPHLLTLVFRVRQHKKVIPWPMLCWFVARTSVDARRTYDIIHCHFGPSGVRAAILKDIGLLRGRLITTFHGYDMTSYLEVHGEGAYDLLFQKGDYFLPVSEHWKERLIELGCNRDKIRVHRMGIEIGRFSSIPHRRHTSNKVHLVSIGRLVEKKGFEYGIRAIAGLREAFPDVIWEVVGDGPLRGELQVLIDGLEINNLVKLVGWKRQEEVLDLLTTAHILVAPSVTASNGDQEGIPVVLMEAMAMGLPVVSTWHGSIPELVRDGCTGFLVPERDVEALRSTLEYLCTHSGLWHKMGGSGRKRVEVYHDLGKQNRKLLSLYHELLGEPCEAA